MITRRLVLAGLMAGAALPGWAEVMDSSPRPVARGRTPEAGKTTSKAAGGPGAEALIEAAKLGGTVAFVVADAATGEALGLPVIDIRWNGRLLVLDAREGLEPLSGQGLWLMDATGAWVCAPAPAA